MRGKRLVSLVNQLNVLQTKPQFVPRCSVLRSMEGQKFQLTVKKNILDLPVYYEVAYIATLNGFSLEKAISCGYIDGEARHKPLSKWLSKFLPNDLVSQYCNLQEKKVQVELTCRYKDFVRMSITKHFVSCFRPNGAYKTAPYLLLQNPEYALLVERDKAGAFRTRIVVRHIEQAPYLAIISIYSCYSSDIVQCELPYFNEVFHIKHNPNVNTYYDS